MTARQPLLVGLKSEIFHKLLLRKIRSEEANTEDVKRTVSVNAVKAFYAVLVAQGDVKTLTDLRRRTRTELTS